MNKFSLVLQFMLGVMMALAFLAGGGIAAAIYLSAKHSLQPERPVFEEERATTKAASSAKNSPKQLKSVAANSIEPGAKPAPSAKQLPPGAYRARVIWQEGLLLRESPNFESASVGGVEYNAQVVVLEESADKEWQRVRLEDGGQEGWIKGGNTERITQ
jgi:hypothetical protein